MQSLLPWYAPFVSGALGDMTASLFTHPMDVFKVQLQLSGEGSRSRGLYSGLFSQLRTASKGNLYRGISAALLRQSIFATLRHGMYYHLNKTVLAGRSVGKHSSKNKPSLGSLQLLGKVGCASFAGIVGALIANPADVVLVRMQSDPFWPSKQRRNYRNAFDGLHQIIRKEGYRCLWKGCTPTLVRAVLITSTQIPSYHSAKRHLTTSSQLKPTSVITHLIAGIFSAFCASVATNPADVVKTRIINMQKNTGSMSYTGPLDCVLRTIRAEGAVGLYKGLSATLCRLVPHTLILWVVQEQVTRAMLAYNSV